MLCEDLDDYAIQFADNHLTVDILTQRGFSDRSKRWCEFILKPKLLKWSTTAALENFNSVNEKKHTKSLQLVDLEDYNELYKLLKSKYAEKALNVRKHTWPQNIGTFDQVYLFIDLEQCKRIYRSSKIHL